MATFGLDTFSKPPTTSSKTNYPMTQNGSTPRSSVIAILMMVTDICCVLTALTLALKLGLERWLGPGETLKHYIWSSTPLPWQVGYLVWFVLALLLVAHHHGLYGHTLVYSTWTEQRRTIQACLIAGLLLCGAMYMMHNITISRAVVVYLVCFTTGLLSISRSGWRYLAVRRHEQGIDFMNVLVVGTNSMA